MIGYLKAKKILDKSKIKISKENINSSDSIDRISAENIYTNVNYPAGNNSAFDGFAIKSKDTISLNSKKKNFLK